MFRTVPNTTSQPEAAPVRIAAAGRTLTLLPDRAVLDADAGTLFVADVHLGKVTAMAHQGVPLNAGIGVLAAQSDLARLAAVACAHSVRRVVVLGDLLHAPASRQDELLEVVCRWRETFACELILVRGNHDRFAGDPPERWCMQVVDNGHIEAGLFCRHEPLTPANLAKCAGFVLCGHVHPVVRIPGMAERFRCFVHQIAHTCAHESASPGQLVLPAFGSFTGGHCVEAFGGGHRVFVIAGQRVMALASPGLPK